MELGRSNSHDFGDNCQYFSVQSLLANGMTTALNKQSLRDIAAFVTAVKEHKDFITQMT
jgi:hypothetical protein